MGELARGRVLSLTGLDRMVPAYPSLEAAVAAGTPVPDTAAVTTAVACSLLDAGRPAGRVLVPGRGAGARDPASRRRGAAGRGPASGPAPSCQAWPGIDAEHIAAAARDPAGG
jgi:hypothetical protein